MTDAKVVPLSVVHGWTEDLGHDPNLTADIRVDVESAHRTWDGTVLRREIGIEVEHRDDERGAFQTDRRRVIDIPDPDATRAVLREVRAERRAQDERWGEQNHPDVSDLQAPGLGEQIARDAAADRATYWKAENARRGGREHLSWDGILLEEVYEALAEEDPAKLHAELIQVAAVAVAWIEAIERRPTEPDPLVPVSESLDRRAA